jgi:pimeloyl-ACP methyl ester carboxylesterase
MQTMRVPVADGVELAVDAWAPGSGAGASTSSGVPFVLAHGLASNARMWDGVAETLAAAGHPVFAVDLRGHGRSSKPDGPYDVPTVAGDLAALIGGLGLDRPVVAGQSWGGNVVLELATREPALVRGIVCVDGGWLEPSAEFASWEACRTTLAPPRLAGRRLAEIEGYIRSAHPDWPESGIRGVLGNFEVFPDGTVAPWLTYDRHIEVLRGLWDHHPADRYAAVRVPALLVPAVRAVRAGGQGGDDGEDGERRARMGRRVEAAAAAIPIARVHPLAGDHDIHAQHPVELAGVMHDAVLDGFLA